MALNATKNRQIIDAALAEFIAHGFHGARMDTIAERAQVSKRTVYKHFASKDALFIHLISQMRASFADAVAEAFNPDQPIADQLRRIGEAEGQLFTSRPFMKMVRLIASEANRDPALGALFPNDHADFGPLVDFMTQAQAHGALRLDDPRLAASQFKDLLKGRAFWPQLTGKPRVSVAEMADIIEQSVAMFLARYAPPLPYDNQRIAS